MTARSAGERGPLIVHLSDSMPIDDHWSIHQRTMGCSNHGCPNLGEYRRVPAKRKAKR